jgi:hypothetical protein
MKKWVKKHSFLCKIGLKGRKKDRVRPLKDKKGHFKFGPSFKGYIKKKDAATPLLVLPTKMCVCVKIIIYPREKIRTSWNQGFQI